jgi:hypothetical protein
LFLPLLDGAKGNGWNALISLAFSCGLRLNNRAAGNWLIYARCPSRDIRLPALENPKEGNGHTGSAHNRLSRIVHGTSLWRTLRPAATAGLWRLSSAF